MVFPLVTIGIPTFNRYSQLKVCLDQTLSQTYPNLEILISDNTDFTNTPEWISDVLTSQSCINYVKQPKNLGLLGNHQFLIDHASGDYFMFLHDDDEIPSNYVMTLMTELLKNPNVSLIGPKCDRYLEGKFWFTYENWDSRGKTTFARLHELIPDAFRYHWRFEQYMYGIFRIKGSNFKMSPTFKGQFYMFFTFSCQGELMNANGITLVKNTTPEEIESYRSNPIYKRYKILRFFDDSNSKSIQQCAPIGLQMSGMIVRNSSLTILERFKLIGRIIKYFFLVSVKYETRIQKKKLKQKVRSMVHRISTWKIT